MPGAGNKSPGGLGKLPFGVESDLIYPQFTSLRMTRRLPTANGARLPSEACVKQLMSKQNGSRFWTGTEYPYPTGDSPVSADILGTVSYSDQVHRGRPKGDQNLTWVQMFGNGLMGVR